MRGAVRHSSRKTRKLSFMTERRLNIIALSNSDRGNRQFARKTGQTQAARMTNDGVQWPARRLDGALKLLTDYTSTPQRIVTNYNARFSLRFFISFSYPQQQQLLLLLLLLLLPVV